MDYASLEEVTARVLKAAPRLDPDRAAFVAAQWSRRRPDGRFELRHDPGHKRVNPVLYRREEARACWRRIKAPCLLVLARHSAFFQRYEEGGREDCRGCIPGLEEAVVDAGHMLHLEQPEAVAEILDEFFRA
jgi:pimeloyl-ACP methyl ester carboxylesterase